VSLVGELVVGVEFAAIALDRRRQGVPDVIQQDNNELQVEDWSTVPEAWLTTAVGRMTAAERELMLRHKIIPYCWLPDCTVHGIVDEGGLRHGRALGLRMVGRVTPEIYRKLVRRCLAKKLEQKAVHDLARSKPWASAHLRLSGFQAGFAAALLLIVIVVAWLHSTSIIFTGLQFLACLFFLIVVCLRCLCMMPLPRGRGLVVPLLRDPDLPVYTVLVPLFREISVFRKIISALSMLDYPVEKLDIKIILEENDRPMHLAVQSMNLPWYFDIIIVPTGKPQTKPRALNYAMQFARGSLATIFDGEDIPQPNQLRLAAAQFGDSADDMACFQAALDFFNPNENWLTRQFAAEYAALFHVVLPGLAAYGLPLPLGGTSNHFRVSALAAVGYWDAFNVTEDADLGIRLARHGYKTGILHSTTFEEANTELQNWMKQRRRWLKGFLQTWLVHNRNPWQLARETGVGGFLAVQAMTLGVFVSALLHPLLLLTALWNFLPANLMIVTSTWGGTFMSGTSLVVLLMGYASAIATSKKGLQRIGALGWTKVLLSIPLYWLLSSAAAWMALWDFIFTPFHWHKTKHGLSQLDK
jgi:glycosyltransferase XagB